MLFTSAISTALDFHPDSWLQSRKNASRNLYRSNFSNLISDLNDLALPFIATFAAGAIAGVSEILTFYPLGENRSPKLS
jgi:hypothetical protein